LARALKEKGVEHVFTLAGGFCNPALEGLMETQTPVINCPHEQVAGHLADGHARITRKPTVCLVGPEGFANAVPAMLEAAGERSPVIFITGSSTLKRQGAGGFKEIDDVAIAAPLVKYSIQITDGERISEFVDRACIAATSGYPGPVHISLPVDIMFSSFEEDVGRHERPYNRGYMAPAKAWPEPELLTGPMFAPNFVFPCSMFLIIRNCWLSEVMRIWGWLISISTIPQSLPYRKPMSSSWLEVGSTIK